jgi:hypothetical protein
MADIKDLESFQSGLETASATLYEAVVAAVAARNWTKAYFDSRAGEDDLSSAVGKLRVQMADGTLNKSISTPVSIRKFLMSARDAMSRLFPQRWYGIRITIYPDKRCEVDYNYDPKCLADPQFIDF